MCAQTLVLITYYYVGADIQFLWLLNKYLRSLKSFKLLLCCAAGVHLLNLDLVCMFLYVLSII